MTKVAASPVKQGRLKRGMTLQDLAGECAAEGAPVTDSTLSRIERGLQTPRPRLREVLARLLDMDIADFDHREATPTASLRTSA